MQVEDSVKSGILFVPPQSFFLRKSWHKKYCALFKASNNGIQRLEIFDNEEAYSKLSPSKIIPLTDCIKTIAAPQKQQSNVFEVWTSTSVFQFSAKTLQEMTDWLAALQKVAFGLQQPLSAPNTDFSTATEKNEENMLYSSMDEPEVYNVKAVDTEATVRNGLRGDYKLIVTSVSISLAEEGVNTRAGRIIFTWPYRHIRRYGCNEANFSFEAGRKCSSGEGMFTFSTKDSSHIFQSVDAHLIALKSSQSDSDPPSSPLPSGNNYESIKDKVFADDTPQPAVSQRHGDLPELAASLNKVSVSNKTKFVPVTKKDKAFISVRAEKGAAETSHRILKPPRKSKSKLDEKDGDRSAIYFSRGCGIHVNSQPNIYEVPNDLECYEVTAAAAAKKSQNSVSKSRRGSSYGEMSSSHEPVYAVLEENACDSALTDELKQVLSASKVTYANLNLVETNVSSDDSHFSADSDSYDHLAAWGEEKSTSPTSTDDSNHLYGKLLTSRTPADEKESSNAYGSLLTKKCDVSIEPSSDVKNHSYMNVFISKPQSSDEAAASSDEFEHFLQNDAEYAQVLKKKSG